MTTSHSRDPAGGPGASAPTVADLSVPALPTDGSPTIRHRPGPAGWLGAPLGWAPLILLLAIVTVLLYASRLEYFGLAFWGPVWLPDPLNPSQSSYGVLVFAAGTAITSAMAVILAMLLSVGLAISLVVFLPSGLARFLTVFVDLLAGIPSVVYGIWGYVVLAPYFANDLEPGLIHTLGWLPGFAADPSQIAGGTGVLLAVIILTFMVVPLTTALVRDSLRSVPRDLEESGLALGATRWEVIWRVYLPHAKRGIWAAVLLGLGRALGETVAVFMVIGNQLRFPPSIFSGTSTIATLLVSQFDSAFAYPDLLRALIEIALVLFLITLGVNLLGRRVFAQGSVSGISVTSAGEGTQA